MAKKRSENILAPPCSVELEKTVLACIVLSEEYLDSYYYLIKEELFFDETNRIIFSAVDKLVLSNKKVDLATVFAQLTAMKQVDKVPAVVLSQLSNYVSGLTNIETHIRLLQELALKRSMIYS